jgi:hypothetical protein
MPVDFDIGGKIRRVRIRIAIFIRTGYHADGIGSLGQSRGIVAKIKGKFLAFVGTSDCS